MRTWVRYFLFQVPGWVLGGLALVAFRKWAGLPLWIAVCAFVLWVLKDFALYPFLRIGYQGGEKTGAERLVGLRGVAQENIDPQGYVRVGGELWRAEAGPGNGPILAGTPLRVVGANGMTLTVAAEERGASGLNQDKNARG